VSEHRVTLRWQRESADFSYESYNRDHLWRFEGGAEVGASAAPAFLGNPKRVDPEAAFVASLSSCHMLTFLAIAARKRLVVDRYTDSAVGFLEKNADGRLAVTRVVLRPEIAFGGAGAPSPDELRRLHEQAHAHCFIANSVRTDVRVEAQGAQGAEQRGRA
jgi:organic hydroperoxide reductase OsmC/OhrA